MYSLSALLSVTMLCSLLSHTMGPLLRNRILPDWLFLVTSKVASDTAVKVLQLPFASSRSLTHHYKSKPFVCMR